MAMLIIMRVNCVSRHFQQYFSYFVVVTFIGGGNQRKPPTYRKSLTNIITLCCIQYTSPERDSNSQHLVVIDTDCICSCKFSYHTITITTSPNTNDVKMSR